MPSLPTELLNTFESEVVAAREVAEKAAKAALTTMAVERDRPFDTMDEPERELRRALRARARQLGGGSQEEGMPQLVEEIAYEQWHRLLFSRFLAENDLLMHPEWEMAVTLGECAELAPEEEAEDEWELAARYAVAMLPGIFLLDDPTLQIRFAPEGRKQLEQIVTGLPAVVFTADDSLGWAYQFWQSKKKDEVNASERKIGGADLYPVTQLFTEDYMVKFLLHNSLGAWWAARHPDSPLVETFDYLRFRDAGTPAAGTFDGWPDTAAEVTLMDPAAGSGHFLVAAFDILTRMRMEEEGLDRAEAGDAVIRDNLFGLEIDPRCTQIAAFNLTLTAWKYGGYRKLPLPNIACSGIPVQGQLEEWVKLAGDDEALQRIMNRLHHLFRNAPDLGSLVNPSYIPVEERMFVSDYQRLAPLLEEAFHSEGRQLDPTGALFGEALKGVTRAAKMLDQTYTLVATNVPYLTHGKQGGILSEFCQRRYPDSQHDLATVFAERCIEYTEVKGTYALVTPQNWQFQIGYTDLRKKLIQKQTWNMIAPLGTRSFWTPMYDFNVVLSVMTNQVPASDHVLLGIDVSGSASREEKASALRNTEPSSVNQVEQLSNPDSRIILVSMSKAMPLSTYADSYQGVKTGDDPRFRRYFWEADPKSKAWRLCQTTVDRAAPYAGRQLILDWTEEGRNWARRQGVSAWGKDGVAVNQMGELPATLYKGDVFDSNTNVIVPKNPEHLEAIWAYVQSSQFRRAVRRIDKATKVTNSSFVKVPFDIKHWEEVAAKAGALPEPSSNDPLDWLFKPVFRTLKTE